MEYFFVSARLKVLSISQFLYQPLKSNSIKYVILDAFREGTTQTKRV